MNRKKYFAKNTALFALNSFGTKIIVFLLVPIYTNVLSTAEYGIIDLITTIATIIVPAIMLNINEAVQRFCLDDGADYNSIMSVGILVLFFSFFIGLPIIPISGLMKTVAQYSVLFYFFCVTQGVCVVFSSYLRGQEKLSHFAICSIVITLTGVLFNILFLVILKTGITGYFWAFILSYIVGAVYAIFAGNIYKILRHFKYDRLLVRKMLGYSIMLIPNTLMWWIMNASDRIMVTSMIGLTANGIYAVSYKVPSVISTMSTVFNQAWSFSAIKEDESEDRESFNRRMYEVLFVIQVLLAGILIAIIRFFMKFYVQESYYEAWKFAVPLLVGYFFMSLGTFFSVQYTVNKDSKGFLFSGMAGAIINICLNFTLIPFLGTMGAAIATMISYICVFAYRAKDTQKYLKLQAFNIRKAILVMLIIAMAFTAFIDNGLYRNILLILEFIIIILMIWKIVKEVCANIDKYISRKLKGKRQT